MIKYNKWIVNILSNNTLKPKLDDIPEGYGGLVHVIDGFIKRLYHISIILKRNFVLSPPWISLSPIHNNNKFVDINNTWSHYFDLSNYSNYDLDPPFRFKKNGDIETNLSHKYYNINININNFDPNIDIIILSSYDDINNNIKKNNYLPYYKQLYKISKDDLYISRFLKSHIKNILQINNYIFIHIRRGDTLYNTKYAPPLGTFYYTSPKHIIKVINKFPEYNNIIIVSNEKNKDYYTALSNLYYKITYKNGYIKKINISKKIYFEDDIFKYMPCNIRNDNYMLYLMLNEIANNASINIGTEKPRLGRNNCSFLLKDI